MLIQTKPKSPGEPVEAVRFLGDPSVHPGIFWRKEEPIRPGYSASGHWRLRSSNPELGSFYLQTGDWILENGPVQIVNSENFQKHWQVVK